MANKTNTVAKGNLFEDRVFSKIKELLDKGDLAFCPKSSYIYQKKSYKANTGTNIETDISIETYIPNANEYSVLTLIECKDYNSPIQVDKIRDFSHRIKDIGAHKGIFITTSKFQKSALDVAKAEKIGLAIMDDTDDFIWKLQRVGKRNYQIRQEIEEYFSDTESTNKYPFIAISENSYYTSMIDFLSDMVEQELKSPFEIPFLEPQKIEEKILDLFKEKDRNDSQYYMKTEELIDFAKNQLNIDLDFSDTLYDEIGYCDFQNNRISITNKIEYNSPKWRFTLVHEIGHYVLHRYLYEKYNVTMTSDDEIDFSFNELNNNMTNRIEIQANIFALKILIPDKIFKEIYFQLYKELGLHKFPILYVDSQSCNVDNYYFITRNIAHRFGVSQEVVKNKLLNFKFLILDNPTINNDEKENSVGELIKEYFNKSS